MKKPKSTKKSQRTTLARVLKELNEVKEAHLDQTEEPGFIGVQSCDTPPQKWPSARKGKLRYRSPVPPKDFNNPAQLEKYKRELQTLFGEQ
ncbi:MAG: hypothetical protein HYV68_03175 [Candidatus Taylorbacteria bacterium]|nr:hypothetical protein [Candidatus Taylorbacteria bacterium]